MHRLKYPTEDEQLSMKMQSHLSTIGAVVIIFVILQLLTIALLYILFSRLQDQDRDQGAIVSAPEFPYQEDRPGYPCRMISMINGKMVASVVSGQVDLVAMVEAKKGIPCNGDALLFMVMPAEKSIFDIGKHSRLFESRQSMMPKFANIGPVGCLFWHFSDRWQLLPQQKKPLPRGCIRFIDRFVSDSDGIIDMTSQAAGL